MEKKLVTQGPKNRQSYTLTLPIEWIKDQKLDKKKKVFLDIVADKAIISTEIQKTTIATFNGDMYYDSLIKVLQGLYRRGINELQIKYTNSAVLEKVVSICSSILVGYEIIDQQKNYVIIKDITKESPEDMHVIMRRAWLIILQLMQTQDTIEIQTYDKNLKRLLNYCQRTLVNRGHLEYTKTPIYYLMTDQLEKIGDEVKNLSLLNKNNPKLQRTLAEFEKVLRVAYELYYSFDEKKYAQVQSQSNDLKMSVKLSPELSVETLHLYNLGRTVNSLIGNIFATKFKTSEGFD